MPSAGQFQVKIAFHSRKGVKGVDLSITGSHW